MTTQPRSPIVPPARVNVSVTRAADTPPSSVLVVGQDEADTSTLAELLRDPALWNVKLMHVDLLATELERFSSGDDIVLIDLGPAGGTGLSRFELIRNAAPEIPIVVICHVGDETSAKLAVRVGAQDYLVWGSIDGDLLARVIRHAIERKRAERELTRNQSRFRAIVENSSDPITIFDATGVIVFGTPAVRGILGYSLDDFIGRNVSEFIRQDSHQHFGERMLESLRRPGELIPVIAQIRHKNGSWRLCEGKLTNLLDEPGVEGIVNSFHDITDERRNETLVGWLTLAVDQGPAAVIMTDSDGHIEYVNQKFTEDTGYTIDEVVGKKTSILKSDTTSAEQYAILWHTIKSGESYRGELQNRRKNGEFYWSYVQISPVRDDTGTIAHFLGVQTDISAQRLLENQFRQAQKMEAVGRLAGGVAHDFNNLLTVILSYTDMLIEGVSPKDPRADDLDQIRKAAVTAASLTRQLLAFSRQQVIEPRLLDLSEIVANTEKMLRRLIGEDIELGTTFCSSPVTVMIDPGQLEQVIMNLAVNSRDAMPMGGKLTLETKITELDDAYARDHWPAHPGRFGMFAVSDTGSGMDETTRARIFEPFYTTKELGKGTGLGLATVYGIVKQSNGFIWVYSEPGEGTTFKIYLPLIDGAAEESADIVRSEAPTSGTETILLVEDSAAVRTAVRQILERYGYTVLEAPNGAVALSTTRRANPIDLLLTDVVMPEMSGRELFDQFAVLRPNAKVLFMSGYTDDAVIRHGVLRPGTAYLQKPFSADSLARKLREVFDSRVSAR